MVVPDKNESGYFWNFMVPVINEAIDEIDFIQVDTYKNPYLEIETSTVDYMVAIYLSWLNQYSGYTIEGFNGISEEKLVFSVVASEDAIEGAHFVSASVIKQTVEQLNSQGHTVAGFNIWNSYYDNLNDNAISTAVSEALGSTSNKSSISGISKSQSATNNDGEDLSIFGQSLSFNMTILFTLLLLALLH